MGQEAGQQMGQEAGQLASRISSESTAPRFPLRSSTDGMLQGYRATDDGWIVTVEQAVVSNTYQGSKLARLD